MYLVTIKNKREIMQKIFYLMAMAIVALTFSACSEDENFLAEVNYPQEAAGDKMVVDAWANNFPLEIKSEGEWRIECSDFITVNPTEGKGNATVKVYVEDNEEEQRLKGNVTIVFPGHEEQNKVLAVEQKWTGEYDENADIIGKTNKIYAVGYGYDNSKGLLANKECVRAQIFKTGQLIEKGVEGIDGLDMHATISTVTGNSISELSNKLTVKASGSGGAGKFKAEARAAFTMNYSNNSNHEYAINYVDAILSTASFDLPIENLRDSFMTTEAYNAINGLNKDYPSNDEGLKALIRAYGTHVVMKAKLGGRVRQSLDVDITKIETSYDLNVFAKASYEGVLARAEGSAEDDFHTSYKQHTDKMEINIDVMGGDQNLAAEMSTKTGYNETNYKAWLKSVTGDNMVLMGFYDDSLLPLYELVDKKKYSDRYNWLKDCLESGQVYADKSTYDSGTVTEFDVPKFDKAYNSTLIKDIMLGGQLVGQVCEEYVPIIDRTKRITVVYPVIGTTVRYNMGFFLGDDTHKPARVSWNGTTVDVSEYSDLKFGQVNKLYLRGASITTTPAEGADLKQGTLQDEYLVAPYVNVNANYSYPLVKIFDKIWTRMNYCGGSVNGNAGRYCTITMDGQQVTLWQEYYTPTTVQEKNFPMGWHVALKDEYTNMHNKLAANGFALPGIAMKNGGVTGFEMYYVGLYSTQLNQWDAGGTPAGLVTSDLWYFGYWEDGAVDDRWQFANDKHSIRLVKD